MSFGTRSNLRITRCLFPRRCQGKELKGIPAESPDSACMITNHVDADKQPLSKIQNDHPPPDRQKQKIHKNSHQTPGQAITDWKANQ